MSKRAHERWNFTQFNTADPANVCEGYCLLSGFVNDKVLGFRVPSDCFCHLSDMPEDDNRLGMFRYDKEVYDFIVSAVNEKVEKHEAEMLWNPGSVPSLAKGCECPDYDNRERDEGRGWIVSITCPLHGFNGTHPKVRHAGRRGE